MSATLEQTDVVIVSPENSHDLVHTSFDLVKLGSS